MNKERRLGRGLEALLGQLPARNEPALPAQQPRPAAPAEMPDASAGGATTASGAPSAEALFRLDPPHASAGQLGVQPHHPPTQQPQPPTASPVGMTRVKMSEIDGNPAQPRQDFDPDEMRSLAESISAHGLLQPVVVRRVNDRYQLVAGERRLRAAIQAGWSDVPVNVHIRPLSAVPTFFEQPRQWPNANG